MARRYRARMGAFDIGQWEFQTVEALARRYRAMKRRADVLERCNAKGVNGEEFAAMRWECAVVEQALRETAGGEWEDALRRVCCDGIDYMDLDPGEMPTSNRNAFYTARREFFWRLWGMWQKGIGQLVKNTQACQDAGGDQREI